MSGYQSTKRASQGALLRHAATRAHRDARRPPAFVITVALGAAAAPVACVPHLGAACPAGRVALENVCVAPAVADFVTCVRSRGTVELKIDRGEKLVAAVEIAGQGASTTLEAKDQLAAKYENAPGAEAEKAIIDRCASLAEHIASSPVPQSATPGAVESRGPAPDCSSPSPWVGYVDAKAVISTLPRNNYVTLSWEYGDNVWVAVELDGHEVRLCGRKQTVTSRQGEVDVAPPDSTVYVPVEDPGASLKLVRHCFAWNAVTKQFYALGKGDRDTVSGGGSRHAHSCTHT